MSVDISKTNYRFHKTTPTITLLCSNTVPAFHQIFMRAIFFYRTTCFFSTKVLLRCHMSSDLRLSAHDTDVLHSPMFSLISTLLSLINQLTIYHAAQERKTIGERCQGIKFGRKAKDRTIESKVQFEMRSGIEFS